MIEFKNNCHLFFFCRSGARLVNQQHPSTSPKLQPNSSSNPSSSSKHSIKSIPRRTANVTSKMDLLNRLQRYLKHKYNGRITELNIDDLQNYSVENGEGSCQVKCPICDKLIKIPYKKHVKEERIHIGHLAEGRCNPYWMSSEIAKHINRHFE